MGCFVPSRIRRSKIQSQDAPNNNGKGSLLLPFGSIACMSTDFFSIDRLSMALHLEAFRSLSGSCASAWHMSIGLM